MTSDITALVAFADTRAADLRFSMRRLPPGRGGLRPALASAPGPRIPGASSELRVLGASHQLVLDLGGARLVETLACGSEGEPVSFPSGSVEMLEGWAYACSLDCHTLADRAGLAELSQELDHRPAGSRLGVRFAGDPLARTVLIASVEDSGGTAVLRWQTWHLYPQHLEVVHTVSTAQVLSHWGEATLCQPS